MNIIDITAAAAGVAESCNSGLTLDGACRHPARENTQIHAAACGTREKYKETRIRRTKSQPSRTRTSHAQTIKAKREKKK